MRPWGLLVLRSALGVVFIAHGLQKLTPWLGVGPSQTAVFFQSVGLVPGLPIALAVGLAELACGTLVLVGAWTMIASVVLLCDIAVAIWKVHLANGFFLNWTAIPGVGHGIEYDLVLAAALACLMMSGGGALSVDDLRSERREMSSAARARLRAAGH
jgi:putative oxidoreductase